MRLWFQSHLNFAALLIFSTAVARYPLSLPLRSGRSSHPGGAHLGHRLAAHDATTLGRTRASLVVLLQLIAFECLLVLELLLGVLVALQDLIVLLLAQLQALVHLTF